MQKLALFMIVAVTTVEFFVVGDKWERFRWLPKPLAYLPELTGVAAIVLVVALGVQTRFRFVRPTYWIVFGLLLLTAAAGAIANNVEPGVLFAGLRNYLRALPWFFIPAVYLFGDRNLRQQLRWLLVICLIQVPIAIEQRIQTALGHRRFGIEAVTGDWTTGTLLQSGPLTIFLICAACVLAAFALRRLLPWKKFAFLFLLVLVPTMINETKITLVLLPLGLALTFMHAGARRARIKQLLGATGLLALFLVLFVPIYDALTANREYGVPLSEYFTNPDYTRSYLFTNRDVGTSASNAGRGDALVVGTRDTLSEPVRAFLGLGIGNASRSALGDQFSGHYWRIYSPFTITGYTRIVLELGLLGFSLLSLFYWLVIKDARIVAARAGGATGALAAAWPAVTVIAFLTLFYTTIEAFASLSYTFFLYAGYMAAERMRLAEAAALAGMPDARERAAEEARGVVMPGAGEPAPVYRYGHEGRAHGTTT